MIHLHEIFVKLNDVGHRRTKVATPRTNGFVERFNRTVLDECFREAFRKTFSASVEELQTGLDTWLDFSHTERPHQGYRNRGKKPVETIREGKQLREQMTTEAA